MENTTYDYIVIGSGFGGSVSAMRLAEKGYSVLVIEKGKRFAPKDFPKTDWDIKKFLWLPLLKCFGFQQLTFFKEVFVLSGVGVGGGSIVYANTHFFPKDAFFNNPIWSHIKDWKKTLTPFYNLARYMLGTIPNPSLYIEDQILKDVAKDMNREKGFSGVDVGVYFGDTKNSKDPYFSGHGPKRTGCIECAGCMVGCRYDAKNTLDKNYLYFAEKFGGEILPETQAEKIEYIEGEYHITTEKVTNWFNKKKTVYKSRGLIISAGVLGTMDILLKQKHHYKTLSSLSDTLGSNIRTNSESICGVSNSDKKLNNGIAISSVFDPDDNTHVEIVKYNDNSGAMGKLGTMATGKGNGVVRTAKLLGQIIHKPIRFLKMITNIKSGKNSIILLVMQSLDESMKMRWKNGLFGKKISLDNSSGQRVPAYIDIGQEVMHRYAKKVKGTPQNVITEIFFNTPMTAHILGGCPMGDSKDKGVVNEKFQVHDYPDMYILDGSIIPCNLGVNPSLTITALSEYAMSFIEDKEGTENEKLKDLVDNYPEV